MRLRHLAIFLGLLPSPATAHDFWLQPERYLLTAGVATPLTLQVGHGSDRRRSPIRKDRVLGFVAASQDARLDLMGSLHPRDPDEDGQLRLGETGLHVLMLWTDHRAESRLSAARFNDYLDAEGITPALEARRREGLMGRDGAERYGRVAKTLVRVGEGGGRMPLTPLGAPLEIVPEADPWSDPTRLPVRVYWQGRPLAGALIKLTDLARDDEPVSEIRTDAAGRARFFLPRQSRWMLGVVWTRPLPPTAEVDFETTFSSLSFSNASDR